MPSTGLWLTTLADTGKYQAIKKNIVKTDYNRTNLFFLMTCRNKKIILDVGRIGDKNEEFFKI